jgi:hypothetical protein
MSAISTTRRSCNSPQLPAYEVERSAPAALNRKVRALTSIFSVNENLPGTTAVVPFPKAHDSPEKTKARLDLAL